MEACHPERSLQLAISLRSRVSVEGPKYWNLKCNETS